MKKAQIHFYQKTDPPYFGVLILIPISKFSKTQKLTQKDPFLYPKTWKKAWIHFYQKTNPPYFGLLILIPISKFSKTQKLTQKLTQKDPFLYQKAWKIWLKSGVTWVYLANCHTGPSVIRLAEFFLSHLLM